MGYTDCSENGLDNSIDEYLAGYNKNIWVFYDSKTKRVTIVDNGRGIPVGWNEKAQMDSLTLVFTQLHAGDVEATAENEVPASEEKTEDDSMQPKEQ